MPSIVHAITEFINSIVGIVFSLVQSVFAVFHAIFALGGDVITSVFKVAQHLIAMVTDVFQGALGFIAANFFAIAALGGAYYIYTVYQARNRGSLRNGKTRT
ncbi:hypothetical protein JR316_0001203 [Psilocybe cubensis]|uniref:Uncharacterized protein n=2 Tax=Psilocybe cubensis TaxID=181762 RepID=A0ACB8HH26_PSICU|nr:hypothetical protein JR316_0001203 [Psilocybe cubensis]KAH9487134.1 hypothetical protein JR316_0001203 [Psilocybe cubensis]